MQRAVLYYEPYEPIQGDMFSCFGHITQYLLHLVYVVQLHEHRQLQVFNDSRHHFGLMSLAPHKVEILSYERALAVVEVKHQLAVNFDHYGQVGGKRECHEVIIIAPFQYLLCCRTSK